jgi:hypothetical protein
MRPPKFLFLVSMVLGLPACSSSVADFVNGTVPADVVAAPQSPSLGAHNIKRSPGNLNAKATDLSVRGNITPTRKILTATDMSAQVSFSSRQQSN